MMEKFRIITLDAERMVTQEIRNKDLQQNPQTCNYEIRLRFDLSRYSADRAIILHTDFQQTNALFWQLSTLLPAVASNDKEGLLEHALAYIDFHSIFHTEDFFDESYLSAPYTLSKEALLKNDKVVHTYKLIKMFERGIELSFDGSTYHRFVAFEKSASMTRHSVISFIDAELQKQLELRLMLGMNLSDAKIRVEPSKFFSYRGLYLTTSTRVESLNLNEETVIVLPDFIEFIPETDIYTAELKSRKSKKDPASFDYWEFKEVKKSPEINLFDGEGLLSPDCAFAINNYLKRLSKENKYKFKGAARSFQVRLPFTKGVLHQVNYVKFFVEELGLPEDNLIVEDFFGIKRDLRMAKVILTKSMFKCAVWLKDYCKALNLGDPMKFFFKQFVDYDHALYVVLTDANLQKPSQQEKLNHQFLSTLSLTSEDFSTLVNRQIESIKELPGTLIKNFSASDDDEEPSIDLMRDRMFSVSVRNNIFFKQNEVKTAVKSMQRDLAFNLGLGKIKVNGENRWFSCDLLGLLLRIAQKIRGADEKKIESLLKRTLQLQYFYMPDNKLSLNNNQPYVLLRNPHLSRNEQVLLHAYVDFESLYKKYFSHLKGVVMVSTKSTAALALSGADYDGDYVKVITDAGVLQAVKSLHTLKGDCYTRNLPVIEIPSGIKSNITAPPSFVSFPMISDTFSNQIGHISNLAVKFMSLAAEVTTQDEKTELLQNAAKCTILTGLDIDAVKTGRRPTKNIEELAEQIEKKKCVFLYSKNKLEELKGLQFFTPRVKDDKGKLTLYNLNEEVLSVTKQNLPSGVLLLDLLPQFQKSVAYINLLPQLYLEYLLKYLNDDDFKITPTSDLYFEFERPSSTGAKRDDWKKKLDKEKIKQVKILVKTFNVILSLAKNVESWRNWWKSQDRDNFVDVILSIQYDANAVIGGVLVEKAKLEMYSMLEGILDLSNIKDVMDSVKEKKWHLTPQESRPKKLAEILGVRVNALPASVISLLTNFSQNGYLLLYYALLHVRAHLESDTDAWTDIAYVEQRNDSTSLEKGLSIAQEDPDQWDEFYKKYAESLDKKWTRTVLKNELIKLCRQRLSNIFAGDFNEALKHFWATQINDQSHKFFWDVFSESEILDNLPQAPV